MKRCGSDVGRYYAALENHNNGARMALGCTGTELAFCCLAPFPRQLTASWSFVRAFQEPVGRSAALLSAYGFRTVGRTTDQTMIDVRSLDTSENVTAETDSAPTRSEALVPAFLPGSRDYFWVHLLKSRDDLKRVYVSQRRAGRHLSLPDIHGFAVGLARAMVREAARWVPGGLKFEFSRDALQNSWCFPS